VPTIRTAKPALQFIRDAVFGSQTSLIVPVPEVSHALSDILLTGLAGDVVPHLTLAWPFKRDRAIDSHSIETLKSIFAATSPFQYQLSSVGRFAGVLYLDPEPASKFADIIMRVWAEFPDCPPYEGAFDPIVPHVTLWSGRRPSGLADQVASRLPLTCRAEEAWLVARSTRRGWRTRQRFTFGSQLETQGRDRVG
jgi:2'-5' RNA ligase